MPPCHACTMPSGRHATHCQVGPCRAMLAWAACGKPYSFLSCQALPEYFPNVRPHLARAHIEAAAARQPQRRLHLLLANAPSELQECTHCRSRCRQGACFGLGRFGLNGRAGRPRPNCKPSVTGQPATCRSMRACVANRCAQQRSKSMVPRCVISHAVPVAAGCRFHVG